MTAPLESEHWYRIAALRPRLRPDVEPIAQRYRGEPWVLLRDPLRERYLRLHPQAWGFARRLDGTRTTAEAWAALTAEAGDLELSQVEVATILGTLHREGLLRSDADADLHALGRLRESRDGAARSRRWLQLLTPRIPLWNPDPWLDRHAETLSFVFRGPAFLAWCALLFVAGLSLVGNGPDLMAAGREVFDPSWLHLVSLAVCFVVIKLLHEIGHGVACKAFGRRAGGDGSVPSMGILLVALLPIAYVDASSAWALRNKWERVVVSLAGMYVELGIAALAALVWSATGPGALHTLAFHAMLVAGVTTLLTNANPLLRFDAYYALADALEIPNLASRSREAWLSLLQRELLGVEGGPAPWTAPGERPWLLAYGLLATLFRGFVLFWLLLALSGRLFFVGAALAIFGTYVWFLRPLTRALQYLIESPELRDSRSRAIAVTAGLVSLAGLLLFVVPFPESGRAEGFLEPRALAWVYVQDEGFLVDALPDGSDVDPAGPALLQLANPEIEARLRQVESELAAVRIRIREAVGRDPARARVLAEDLAVLEARQARWRARADALVVPAPFRGTWVAREIDALRGAFVTVDPERPLGLVADFEDLRVRVATDQELGPRLIASLAPDAPVSLRLHSDPGHALEAVVERIVPGGRGELPSAALGIGAGGGVRTDGQDPEGRRSQEPFFEIVVRPLGPLAMASARTGERVAVRFPMDASPIGPRLWRSLRQLLQRRLAG